MGSNGFNDDALQVHVGASIDNIDIVDLLRQVDEISGIHSRVVDPLVTTVDASLIKEKLNVLFESFKESPITGLSREVPKQLFATVQTIEMLKQSLPSQVSGLDVVIGQLQTFIDNYQSVYAKSVTPTEPGFTKIDNDYAGMLAQMDGMLASASMTNFSDAVREMSDFVKGLNLDGFDLQESTFLNGIVEGLNSTLAKERDAADRADDVLRIRESIQSVQREAEARSRNQLTVDETEDDRYATDSAKARAERLRADIDVMREDAQVVKEKREISLQDLIHQREIEIQDLEHQIAMEKQLEGKDLKDLINAMAATQAVDAIRGNEKPSKASDEQEIRGLSTGGSEPSSSEANDTKEIQGNTPNGSEPSSSARKPNIGSGYVERTIAAQLNKARLKLFFERNKKKIIGISAAAVSLVVFSNGIEDNPDTRTNFPLLSATNATWDFGYAGFSHAVGAPFRAAGALVNSESESSPQKTSTKNSSSNSNGSSIHTGEAGDQTQSTVDTTPPTTIAAPAATAPATTIPPTPDATMYCEYSDKYAGRVIAYENRYSIHKLKDVPYGYWEGNFCDVMPGQSAIEPIEGGQAIQILGR